MYAIGKVCALNLITLRKWLLKRKKKNIYFQRVP